MKLLVVNTGASSLGYQLLEMADRRALVAGLVERIGELSASLTHRRNPGTEMEAKIVIEPSVPDHGAGLATVVRLITHPDHGVLGGRAEIGAVAHHYFRSGEGFQDPALLEKRAADVRRSIARLFPDVPLMDETAADGWSLCREVAGYGAGFPVGGCLRTRLAG